MTVLNFKKFFSIVLSVVFVVLAVCTSTLTFASQALAKPQAADMESYIGTKNGNSVDAYKNLQRATYSYRNEGLEGEGSQTGRLGNRVGLAERTGGKLNRRVDKRRDLTSQSNSVEDAAQNMVDNTQGAFQRSGEKIQRNLNLDRR